MGILGRYDETLDDLVSPGAKAGRWRYDETSEEGEEREDGSGESDGEQSEILEIHDELTFCSSFSVFLHLSHKTNELQFNPFFLFHEDLQT